MVASSKSLTAEIAKYAGQLNKEFLRHLRAFAS